MTLRGFTGAIGRHRLLVVAVLVLFAPFYALVAFGPPTYYAKVDVFVLGPPTESQPNVLGSTRTSIIATAGVLERSLEGRSATRVVSGDVSLLDQGIRSGTSVTIPNTGGQWANNFEQPVLVVEAVDADPAAVQERVDATTDEIRTVLERIQVESGAPTSTWLTTEVSPRTPIIVAADGHHLRALAYLTALAGGVVIAAVVLAETRAASKTAAEVDIEKHPVEHELSGSRA
jgi:hypothetical protein